METMQKMTTLRSLVRGTVVGGIGGTGRTIAQSEDGVGQLDRATETIYHRPLFTGVVVRKTKGESLVSSGAFKCGVHGVVLPDGVGEKTRATTATFHEVIKSAKFFELCDALDESGKREWEQSQVSVICFDHPEKLRGDEYGTMFRLVGGYFVVVHKVGLDLGARVYEYKHDHDWDSQYKPIQVTMDN